MKKILVLLLTCLVCFSFAAEDQKVMVSGVATEKKPINEAYEIALHNAFVSAVEKNLGTWLKSQSSSVSMSGSNEFAEAKVNILAKADDFISDYKVVKKGMSTKGFYEVLVDVTVSSDRLSSELRKYVSDLKSKMDNPSIAFVLTSWEKKGVFTTVTADAKIKSNNSYSDKTKSSDDAYDEAAASGAASTSEYGSGSMRSKSSNSARGDGSGYASVNQSESVSAKGRASGSARGRVNVNGDGNSASYGGDYDESASGEYSGSRNASGSYSGSYQGSSDESASGEYSASRSSDVAYAASAKSASHHDRASSVEGNSQSNTNVSASVTTGKIDETVYAKFADMSIIDGFQQEFKEKGFDLKAADKAREIAVAPSALQTGININDRSAVRNLAEKEGANFVARGEVMLLSQDKSQATGQPEITAKIGTEIIDVNSGDVVASYTNTVTASNSNIDKAKAQVIKKASVVAARTLASQTLQTWQERAEKGRQYTVEIRNIKKARAQKLPIEKALKSIGSISSQTSPSSGIQDYTVVYKGSKSDLGMAIIEALGDAKGFGEDDFDGPNDDGGKIVFTFTK